MTLDIPKTTLFLLQSVDGKISTGDKDSLDADQDFPRIAGIKEGLYQYYDLEQRTDINSFNSGRVQAKIGVNTRNSKKVKKIGVNFLVVDSKPHLDENGAEYFAKRSKMFILITTNKNHPAYSLLKNYSNIKIFYYKDKIDFVDLFVKLKKEMGIKRITIQTGGTLNAELLRLKLIDRISIVVAPCLIGGVNTQSLIGGESLHSEEDLKNIKALKLVKNETLKNSYLHLVYKVFNDTIIT